MEKYYYSSIKQKIILLLMTGLALGFSRSPRQYFKITNNLSKEWIKINRRILYRTIREFKYHRLVDFREESNGIVSITLTDKGKKEALRYNIENMKIQKPLRWDKKWRFVIFDIPEKKKAAREVVRKKLNNLGFYQVQKSVWVYPYECKKEIDFLVEFFEARNYVRYVSADFITNDAELKLLFILCRIY